MADVDTSAADPSPRLAAAFRAIAPRMQGLDFVNPNVDVEAVGFAPWQGRWLGVMVTPWCMNLLLLPLDPAAWQPLAVGAKRRYRFPAGAYEFVGAQDAALGDYQLCSLISPLLQFDDHDAARLVARLAREALFDPANSERDATFGDGAASPLQRRLEAPLSKRDFLRGRVPGGDDAKRG